jgi:hypothetical protein
VRLPGLERQPQRHALAQNVLLSDNLAQVLRTQSLSEGLVGMRGGVNHYRERG